jgi:hypothetical protein
MFADFFTNLSSLPVRKQGCQIFWHIIPKPDKKVPNEYKMYQMVIQYPKSP